MEKKDCPRCGAKTKRIPRTNWMHWLPQSKLYECTRCGNRFLVVLGVTIFTWQF